MWNLTTFNRQLLLHETKKTEKELGGYKYVWTRNGDITFITFGRKKDTDRNA